MLDLISSAPANHPLAPSGRDPRPAVLLLHGLCANPLEMMPLARHLRRAGYHVEAPALPGYGVAADGDSAGKARRAPPFEQWLEQACAHYDALAARHEQVVVGGLSMGAVLTLELGLLRRPAALLLVSTPLHFDGWNVSPWRRLLPIAYLPPLRYWLRFKETSPFGLKNTRLREWVAQAMRSAAVSAAGAASLPADSLYQASRLLRHVRPQLRRIGAPALVLHASDDDVSGPRSVHELVAQLPQTEVKWFHDSYHMLTLDNEREAVCEAALQFLRKTVPLAGTAAARAG
ncbi:MAG: alpha/beta fold hydrolase [Burkholderiaceae bacterium]